jgi:DNA-binding winged helix-turn-helix (wHTH) protein
MAASRVGGVDFRERRRWSFADCVFDEANWTLFVGGSRVAIEIKPLEFLRELLLRAGNVVSKEELLDAIWPDVEVVEASLTTAVRKLRTALRDDRRKVPIIETVPRIGYRLAVPVAVEDMRDAPAASRLAAPPAHDPAPHVMIGAAVAGGRPAWLAPRLLSISGAIAIALAAIAVATTPSQNASASRAAPTITQRDAVIAMRKLDIGKIETMLAAGWDPNASFDKEGTDALMYLLNICEWDPGHNRRQMLLMARTLLEGGVKIDHRNVFGDTAYSIAKADRYCGPDHPVTQMLEAMCYGGDMGPKDLCLATYELNAEQRRVQGLPPKG